MLNYGIYWMVWAFSNGKDTTRLRFIMIVYR
ncbi:hypothetical protein Goshw_019929 [Gossypium schwendimanii]|uniref:Uncharacterized protein n=1 Tax=Gossypium schwendimanii TaxID=34291 RepID=A0A7J9LPT1_GOSSC|nr:hypothetical protein [Gossypium schwendimanii]